ncbi:hypothetical protein BLOT_010666 [Blomia tropicalis]|nr:hypothetical protein BLOT_010666 [Blomia tropicalis]
MTRPAHFTSKRESNEIFKISRSDLPIVLARKQSGGTTVSATSYLANRVGIRVFVTGGIGGVHRGVEHTMDISADLTELSRTPITVISAGIKSILDIGRTLEVLETNGVCVAVYQGKQFKTTNGNSEQVTFPAFFTPDSGISVNYNLKTSADVAELMRQCDSIGLESAILLAVPNDIEEGKVYHQKLEKALLIAEREMKENKSISGKRVTPFLLSKINELTGGESLQLNQQLIQHNALIGAQVAVEYSNVLQGISKASSLSTPTPRQCSHRIPVVIGGSVYDIVAKADRSSSFVKKIVLAVDVLNIMRDPDNVLVRLVIPIRQWHFSVAMVLCGVVERLNCAPIPPPIEDDRPVVVALPINNESCCIDGRGK